MFLGTYQHALDEKSRLIIPSRFREGLGNHFIPTLGLDKAIFLYPMAEWEKIEDKLRSLPITSSDARAFSRVFFSGAVECEPDRQGRILLPPTLKKHANLEKEAVLLGVSSRVEIWSLPEWEHYQSQAVSVYEQTAEHLERLISI